jgi:cobalt-zinc-cadmium efflux system outer membrane protein
VALARAEADEVAAGIKTAQMRPNPVFTFMPQYASFRAPVFTPWFLGPSLSVPIETAGKRSKRTEQALAAAEAARWRVSARAWAARSRVRAAMLELHGARENIRLLETEQTLHDEAIKKLTAQMEAGDVSPFELTQARLMLNRTRLALQDARRIAATGEARLAAAVGLPLNAIKSVKVDFSAFHRLPEAGNSRKLAFTRRADLMALLSDYAAAEAALKLELARQYPDMNISPGYDYNSGQNRWQLGLNVALPLNRNRGPIAEAEARRITAEKRFLAQQAAIQGELDIALAAYQASRAKATTAAQLAQEADAASDTTKKMVEAGNVSALELTRRQIEASAAKVALMAANLEAQTAAGALEDAMQSPLR